MRRWHISILPVFNICLFGNTANIANLELGRKAEQERCMFGSVAAFKYTLGEIEEHCRRINDLPIKDPVMCELLYRYLQYEVRCVHPNIKNIHLENIARNSRSAGGQY
jgi:hypothetical protein